MLPIDAKPISLNQGQLMNVKASAGLNANVIFIGTFLNGRSNKVQLESKVTNI